MIINSRIIIFSSLLDKPRSSVLLLQANLDPNLKPNFLGGLKIKTKKVQKLEISLISLIVVGEAQGFAVCHMMESLLFLCF